jgi:hypothetical protein
MALAIWQNPDLAAEVFRRPATTGFLGIFLLALGTLSLRRALRHAPRASLTMGAP